ncbi:MAG: hypothetical protein KDA96_04710 [Planctomycetaceae bacterium]|nr:hypothetical protein [Planctomycetaceae bacterium]
MSGLPYIDADTLQDARNAWGCGIPLSTLAGKLGVTEADLRRRLEAPGERPEPANGTDPDLWAGVDRHAVSCHQFSLVCVRNG